MKVHSLIFVFHDEFDESTYTLEEHFKDNFQQYPSRREITPIHCGM